MLTLHNRLLVPTKYVLRNPSQLFSISLPLGESSEIQKYCTVVEVQSQRKWSTWLQLPSLSSNTTIILIPHIRNIAHSRRFQHSILSVPVPVQQTLFVLRGTETNTLMKFLKCLQPCQHYHLLVILQSLQGKRREKLGHASVSQSTVSQAKEHKCTFRQVENVSISQH